MEVQRIFISYRVSDTRDIAYSLHRELSASLGKESVFIDSRIQGGEKWPKRLQDEVLRATAMLCLIGKHWLSAKDPETGARRLHEQDDWVRREILGAMDRNILIVPVLINDAPRPQAADLPRDISSLSTLQSRPLRSEHWEADVLNILKDLGIDEELYRGPYPETLGAPVGTGSFLSLRRDVRHYLESSIKSGEGKVPSSSHPYIDLEGEPGTEPSQVPEEYPRKRGYLLSMPQIQPEIAQVDGGIGNLEGTPGAVGDIGWHTRKVASVLKVLRANKEPIVLLGQPGSGKSTTLRRLFIQLAKRAKHIPGSPIPIYIELGTFRKQLGPDSNETILELIRSSVPPGVPSLRRHLGPKTISTSVVLLFDAMDEIPRQGDYADRAASLAKFATDFLSIARTVFACRTNDFDPGFGHRQLFLMPFDEKRIRLYLRKTLGKKFLVDGKLETSKEAAGRLMRSDELGPESGNPLTLTLAAEYIREKKEWPRGRNAVYSDHLVALADKALRRKRIQKPSDKQIVSTVDAWASLAYEVFKRNGSVFVDRDDLRGTITSDSLESALGGGLVLEDRESGRLKFRHHRLQEYLVARRLHLPDPPQPDWNKVLASPRWQETLLSYFAIGGLDEQPLTVISDTLKPAEGYLKRLRLVLAHSHKGIASAKQAHDAIKPDITRYVGEAGFYEDYSDGQRARKNKAARRLNAVLRRDNRLKILPYDRESNWSDHVLLAARVIAIMKPPSQIISALRETFECALRGLLDFGRPATQVRMLSAWKENSDWCPPTIIHPVRESKLDWVRSQAIHALVSAPAQAKNNHAFTLELERELLHFNLPATLPVFWEASATSANRRAQAILAAAAQCVYVLTTIGLVLVMGACMLPGFTEATKPLQNVAMVYLLATWMGINGVVAFLSPHFLPGVFILRVAISNAVLGGIGLAALRFMPLVGRPDKPFSFDVWMERIAIISCAIGPLSISLLIYLSIKITFSRLLWRIAEGSKADKAAYSGTYLRKCMLRTKEAVLPLVLAAGVVFALTLSDSPVFRIGAGLLLGILILLGAGFIGFFILKMLKGVIVKRWEVHSSKPVLARSGRILLEVLSVFVAGGMATALFTISASFIIRFFSWATPDWLRNLFQMDFSRILSLNQVIGALAALAAIFIIKHALALLGPALADLRSRLFRKRIQERRFNGSLPQWEERFRISSPYARRDLLESFDHRKMGASPQDALAILLRLEILVPVENPEAPIFHKTMFKLQEAIRQQRW